MNAVVKHDAPAQSLAVVGESSVLLTVIERAASNPAVDVDKMERLMAMHQEVLARQARAEYATALAEMQDELPVVAERGDAAGRYTYALWEDINTAIKPVLKAHGFALSFRTDFTDGIAVTGVLSHRGGHEERTTIKLPADSSGNKNAVQAVASSVSYGKRYAAGALLNLTSHGEDDDAYAAAEGPDPAADWYAQIETAATHAELKALADEIKNAGLAGRPLRNVRAMWAKRNKEVAA